MSLSQNILKEYVEYSDGELIHKKNRRNVHLSIGSKLGYIHNGYKVVRFFGKKYGIHQLVYLYHYGFIPEGIDHSDGNTLNNKIENLRSANKSQNAANQKIIKETKSGLKGVRIKKDGRICAVIGFQAKRYFLGDFKSSEEAHKAYLKKASELFGEYARQPID
jgi:hypothetical protein